MKFLGLKHTQAYAELSIWGANLDVDKISEMLGMKVDYVSDSDDYSEKKDNSVTISPSTCPGEDAIWTYKTGSVTDTEDLADQLDEVIAVFKDKVSALNEIKEIFTESRIVIEIVLYNRHQEYLPGFALNPEQIAFLASIGATIDFDIYL